MSTDYLPTHPTAASDQLRSLASDLEAQEAVIERGVQAFTGIGLALAKIRDKRLYRQEYATFESYCQTRWGLSRSRAYRLIDAATITDAMEAALEMSPNGDTPLPANEGQARELVGLTAEDAVDVMHRASEATDGRPTAAAIRSARDGDADAGEEENPAESPIVPEQHLPPLPENYMNLGSTPPPASMPAGPPPPAPKEPRRKPITEAFDNANYDLRRVIERVVRLTEDDRFKKNKDQITGSNLSDLIRARDALNGVIQHLEG